MQSRLTECVARRGCDKRQMMHVMRDGPRDACVGNYKQHLREGGATWRHCRTTHASHPGTCSCFPSTHVSTDRERERAMFPKPSWPEKCRRTLSCSAACAKQTPSPCSWVR